MSRSSRIALGSLVVLGGALLAGCASDDWSSHASGVTRYVDHEALEVAARQRALVAERIELRRAEAEFALTKLGQGDDHGQLRRAHDIDPAALRSRHPADLASLAPAALRVYDLSAVLADGPDDPVRREGEDRESDWMDGERHLLERITARLRSELASQPGSPDDAVIDVCGACIFASLPSAAAFEQLEMLLDRHATTGGGFTRVEVLLGSGAGDVPQDVGPAWRTADFEAIQSRLAERGDVQRLVVDVPFGRERGARRGGLMSYVKDFDVDAGSGLGDPLINTLVDGLMVSAVYAPGTGDAAPQLAVRVSFAEALRPVPEFTTLLSQEHGVVKIQIPEFRVDTYNSAAAPDPSQVMSGRVFGDRALYVHAVPYAGAAARPAWSRVQPADSSARSLTHPLLTNALELAATGADGSVAAVREALRIAEEPIWWQRVRPSSEQEIGVLFRWPVTAETAANDALRAAEVTAASEYGFIDVSDGHVLACVDPNSAQALARVLGRLDNSPGAPTQPTFELVCPEPVATRDRGGSESTSNSCADVTNISFIQDFDVEIARDAAIADPIVGVLQSGAVVAAQPVPSAGPGVYDVRIEHAVLDGPIPVFTTGLGMGSDVTIQLPRMRHHATWVRVRAEPGQTVPLTTEVVVAAGDDDEVHRDVRRFALRRLR